MNDKARKNRKTSQRELLIAICLLLLLIAVVVVIIVASNQNHTATEPTAQANAPQMPYTVPGFSMLEEINGITFDNGLQVLCAGRYSGSYLEDGTDEQIRDVLSIVVSNNGTSLVEYGTISFSYGKQTAEFEFSGLPVGASVLVQEKNRITWNNGTKITDLSCSEVALPASIVLDFGDDFELYADEGVINVKNISETDFSEDVSVFYKNFDYGLFLGGITYRARITGGIKAGEIAQSLQKHYQNDTSAILYMAYGK